MARAGVAVLSDYGITCEPKQIRLRLWKGFGFVILYLLTACTSLEQTPKFEPASCQFKIPTGVTAECGYLIVPEERNGISWGTPLRLIRLHVGIFKSYSETPAPDPVVYLYGGAGGYPFELLTDHMPSLRTFLLTRDLILLEQRGGVYAEPSLNCPERSERDYEDLDQNLSLEARLAYETEAFAACRERLVREGINLNAYNSASSAADLNDLRLALGYDEWNLYGVSYGSRLVLTVMRDFPQGIRSAILDSVYPPQVDLYETSAANTARAFNLLTRRCAEDHLCSTAFPDLETVYFDLVERLNTEPIIIEVEHPETRKQYQVSFNGDDFALLVISGLNSKEDIQYIPRFIYTSQEGDYQALSGILQQSVFSDGTFSEGLNASVQCAEEIPFNTPGVGEGDEIPPGIREPVNNYFVTRMAAICKVWDVESAAPIENEPVTSSLPTLLLSGEIDPSTPPAWAQMAAETLDHAHYLEFPGVGHGVFFWDSCAARITSSFLEAPTEPPDSSCLAGVKPVPFVVY